MSGLIDWFMHVLAILSMIPFVPFFLVWFAAYYVHKEKKKATRLSMDITCVLLVFSLWALIPNVTGSPVLFWLLVLLFLIAAGLIGRAQNRKHGKVNVRKLLAFLTRVGFVLLSVVYFVLLLVGIVQSINEL